MNASRTRPRLTSLAPQLLVANLERSIDFYRGLGFEFGKPWNNFYAIAVRDGLELHLKMPPRGLGDERRPRDEEHLAATAGVDGIAEFYAECVASGATILRPLAATAWGTEDFYLEDPDGNVIVFGGRPSGGAGKP